MQPMLNIALRAARSASELIFRSIERLDTIKVDEKDAKDYVSEVDRAAEQKIIDALRKAYPTHGILGEETGLHKGSGEGEDYLWIIDPLDGTTNFLHGIPHWALSLGLEEEGEIVAGAIYDPTRDELFWAEKGIGAFLNDRRIRASERRNLADCVFATGIPFLGNSDHDRFTDQLRAVMAATAGVRRQGAASLDLAYVAAGRYDGFWENGLKPWDIAAGIILLKEAGGYISDMTGGSRMMSNGEVVAGNARTHHRLLQLVRKPRTAKPV